MDVIRGDQHRMKEYIGDLHADAAVWRPFEHGLAAMALHQWGEAIGFFREAQAKANGAQFVPIANQIGVCHYMQARPDDAIGDFEEAARLATEYGDELGKAPALGNIAAIRYDYGDLAGALDYLQTALALVRKSGDQRVQAPYLDSIGSIYRELGDPEKALQFHEEALAISRGSGDSPGVASCLGNMGSSYCDKDELDEALQHFEKALAVSRDAGDRWGMAGLLAKVATVRRYRGELDEALALHEEALALLREIGYQAGVARELGSIGLILVDKKLYRQATPALAQALSTFLSMGTAHGQRQAILGLSKCDDRLGREEMQAMLEQAGLGDAVAADVLARVDKLRLRRPRQSRRRRAPFVLGRLAAGAR